MMACPCSITPRSAVRSLELIVEVAFVVYTLAVQHIGLQAVQVGAYEIPAQIGVGDGAVEAVIYIARRGKNTAVDCSLSIILLEQAHTRQFTLSYLSQDARFNRPVRNTGAASCQSIGYYL